MTKTAPSISNWILLKDKDQHVLTVAKSAICSCLALFILPAVIFTDHVSGRVMQSVSFVCVSCVC